MWRVECMSSKCHGTFSVVVGITHKNTVDFFDEVSGQFDVHILLPHPSTQTQHVLHTSHDFNLTCPQML